MLFRTRTRVAIGLIALELATLPVAAQVVDRTAFNIEPVVIASEVPLQPEGESVFFVASNAPFVVEVEHAIGEINVELSESGQFGTMNYGSNAQHPGGDTGCMVANAMATRVYASKRKTAAEPGPIESQAVMVRVSYDPVADPVITIAPKREGFSRPGRECDA